MSDTRTPEHKAADDALLDAIQRRVRADDGMDADEVVQEYIVVVYIEGIGLMERNSARYGFVTRDSGVGPHAAPMHSLKGLLAMADDWLDSPEDNE